MSEVTFLLNGQRVTAAPGSSVAAALLAHGVTNFRRSVNGEARAPLCGMGICYECQLTIDGRSHQKSCQIVVNEGMIVDSDE